MVESVTQFGGAVEEPGWEFFAKYQPRGRGRGRGCGRNKRRARADEFKPTSQPRYLTAYLQELHL